MVTPEFSVQMTSLDHEWTFDLKADRRVVRRPLGKESDSELAMPIGFEMYQFWVAQEVEQLLTRGRTNLASLHGGLRHVEVLEALTSRGSWP